jgi:geranylgeranyl diphosphate synthase, type I
MNDFISYKKEISAFLTSFLNKKQQELEDSHFTQDVFERLMPLATSGKMLRGSLLINVYEKLVNQKYSEEVLRAAVALELIGTSLLIHDDIIDQDNLRRGHETLHSQYQKLAQQKEYPQPQRFGESFAICVGDLGIFLAYELLSGDLVKLFSKQLSITILGEMHDVELALMSGEAVAKENILQMYLDKTSSYSTCLPLMAGAILAQESKELAVQLNELGKTLGLIFQIKDDELGLFGDETKTGKPVGADIREGKKTLYYYYLEQIAPNSFAENGVEEVLTLMKKHGIEELVKNDLVKLETKAKQQIENLLAPEKLKKMMSQFLDKITNRIR